MRSSTAILALLCFSNTFVAGLASKSDKSAEMESEWEMQLYHDHFDSAVENIRNLSDYLNTLSDQGWYPQDLGVGKRATKLSNVFDRLYENADNPSHLASVFYAEALIRVARKEFEADDALYKERLKTGEVKQLDEKLYDALYETMEEKIQHSNHASS